MHPRIGDSHVVERRKLYKAGDWKQYEALVKNEIRTGTVLAASGHMAMDQILGISH